MADLRVLVMVQTTGSSPASAGVIVTAPEAGTTLHYTLNGAEPTESDPSVASGGSVAITQSATVADQAILGSGTGGYSREGLMTPAVSSVPPTPPLVPSAWNVTSSCATSLYDSSSGSP